MPMLDLDENNAHYQIKSYEPGRITINDTTYQQSVIVTPNQLVEDWPPALITELTAESLNVILSLKPDVLLLGTGSELVFPSADVYGHLINAGIGVEIMTTRAACRTYNALSAENRLVAAALIIK